MKKRTMTTAAAMLAAVWIAPPAVARAPCKDLLPEVVYPCEGSGFCGIWGEAEWDGILRHCLAVEGRAGALRAIYAYGKAPEWNIRSPSWVGVKAQAKGDTLEMHLPNGARIEYRLKGGQLHGEYYWEGNATASIVMGRLPR